MLNIDIETCVKSYKVESASVQVWGTWGRQFESGLPESVFVSA